MKYYKNERISLDTAKLAKEIGFKEFTRGLYVEYLENNDDPEYPEGGGPFSTTKGEIEFHDDCIRNGEKESGDFSNNTYTSFACPTQEILHKWLREEHGFYVNITNWEGEKWYFEIQDLKKRYSLNELKIKTTKEPFEFDCYEIALEQCLYETLKLLK